ncbi:D-ribose pyranase [Vagococcus sp. JNUCC 83]
MKKSAVINSEISKVIANMGHFDLLSIGDAGMPVPRDTKKIDLAVTNGVPSFLDVLDNVLEELEVQKIFLAEEIKTANPTVLLSIEERFKDVPIEFIPHNDMKGKLSETHAFIRTGEMTPYANILLESGVTF